MSKSEADGFESVITADVQGSVGHVAPCTPDCGTCYPKPEKSR